jgi:hypothetical protein
MAKKLENMTIEELEALQISLNNKRDDIKEELRGVVKVLDTKLETRNAQRLADTLSDDQKRALLQVLRPESIESGEGFGN